MGPASAPPHSRDALQEDSDGLHRTPALDSPGHCFALVLMDYATRYPEVVPLRGMQAAGVARALMHLFAQVGLPREVVTD